jgi:secreted trypsin-like serine protease
LNANGTNPNPPIIGGQPVNSLSEAPWQGAIILDGSILDGGCSIIGNRWLVTAAHCVRFSDVDENQTNRFQIRVGSLQWSSGGQLLTVDRIVVHENYIPSPNNDNDIALIHVTSDIVFSSNQVQAITIASHCNTDEDDFYRGECVKAFITGWGNTIGESTTSISSILRKISIPIISNHNSPDCIIAGVSPIVPRNIIAYESGQSTASGDSGGPMVVTIDNVPYLVGITSRGCPHLEAKHASIFTKVRSFDDWIFSHSIIIEGTKNICAIPPTYSISSYLGPITNNVIASSQPSGIVNIFQIGSSDFVAFKINDGQTTLHFQTTDPCNRPVSAEKVIQVGPQPTQLRISSTVDCDVLVAEIFGLSPNSNQYYWQSSGNIYFPTITQGTIWSYANQGTGSYGTVSVTGNNSCGESTTINQYYDYNESVMRPIQFNNSFPLFNWEYLNAYLPEPVPNILSYRWYLNDQLVQESDSYQFSCNAGSLNCGIDGNTLRLEGLSNCGDYKRINEVSYLERACYNYSLTAKGNKGSVRTFDSKEIGVYPNPASNRVNIKLPSDGNIKELILKDVNSKTILNDKTDDSAFIWDVSTLPNGIYFLVVNGGEKIFTQKLTIMK